MRDEDLRELYRSGLRDEPPRPDVGPVTEQELEALVSGSLPEEMRGPLLDRVMSDPELFRAFELLRSVQRAGDLAGSAPARASRRPFLLAAAAVVALVLGTTVLLRLPGGQDAPRMRGSLHAGDVLLRAPADGASVAGNVTLVWSAVDGAVRYDVEVFDAGGAVAVREAVTDTVLVLASGALDAAGGYRWWVVAARPDGGVQSEIRTFQVEP